MAEREEELKSLLIRVKEKSKKVGLKLYIQKPMKDHSILFQFSSVAQSWPTLRPRESQHARPPCPSPTPGVHVHRVGDAIQPSHPLSSLYPPALNPSQHQGLFK